MLKRLSIILLTVASLCMAFVNSAGVTVSEPMFAYMPFPLDGLNSRYKEKVQGKFATAPSTVYFNGEYHQFYCSNGQESDNFITEYDQIYNGENAFSPADHIRYRSSKDGVNWSAPRVVMHVKNPAIEKSTCDPSVVYGGDGYWYMLYTGVEAGRAVVYLARSNYVQGPYFKYVKTAEGVDKWENEIANGGTPKVILGEKPPKGMQWRWGAGMTTIVKVPGAFWVWYRVSVVDPKTTAAYDNEIRFTTVSDLTQLNDDSYMNASYKEGGVQKSFSKTWYNWGDVRWNDDEKVLQMWAINGYLWNVNELLGVPLDEKNHITKFESRDGLVWERKNSENLYEGDLPDAYKYNFIHNIGVSGDLYGYVKNDGYLISFPAPYLDGQTDNKVPGQALNRSITTLDNDTYQFHITCHLFYDQWQECKKKNVSDWDTTCDTISKVEDRLNKCEDGILHGYWPMWQLYIGGTWVGKTIEYSPLGFKFPKGVSESADIAYFTGDYDGDGISDLGAVDRSTKKWYIYSSRNSCYINWKGVCKSEGFGEVLISDMNSDYEVVTGDYDGDGKTDIGAVNKKNGKWYIYSSADQKKGIGSSSSKPNYIPWGWKWDKLGSQSKIVVGDYNGDGLDDRAIYNGSQWYIISTTSLNSNVSQGFYTVLGTTKINYGWKWKNMGSSDIVVPGDFDGDGITDRAFYSNGRWTSLSTRAGGDKKVKWRWQWTCNGSDTRTLDCTGKGGWKWQKKADIDNFAHPKGTKQNMQPLAGDYDGDGVFDLVEVNTSSGEWRIYGSLNRVTAFPDGRNATWAELTNAKNPVVLVGDFDGDGKADRAFVDKTTRKFYVISSKTGKEGIKTTVRSVPGSRFLSLSKSASDDPIDDKKPVAPATIKAPAMNVAVDGKKVSVTNVEYGSKVAVFDMLGKKILEAAAGEKTTNFEVPSYGKYIVRAGAQSRVIMVK